MINYKFTPVQFTYGKISEVIPSKGLYRVSFDDRGDVSRPLPRLHINTLSNKDEGHFDVNEHVVVIMDAHFENGVILGAINDKNNLPPVGNKDKRRSTFSDGSFVEFDRSTGTYQVNVQGKVLITAAQGIELNGNSNDGLIKVVPMVAKHNLIVTNLNALRVAMGAWSPVAGDGGAALKLAIATWLTQMLTALTTSDVKNSSVKQ